MIRRSRGYAPLPFMLSEDFQGQVLAVGGELKNTFCIGKNQLFYPSPYVGDMADLRTVQALEESILRMEELLETKPAIVACDMHPKYNTTLVAEEQGIPVLKVQHHYAHIVSCMAENDHAEPVIGVSFDGTGYGTDGTIWGGEIMKASYQSFTRLGSIRPFVQIGGDAAAKEGWRIAVSMINSLYPDRAAEIAESLDLCGESVRKLYEQMAARRINSVVSTSAGRLFDAVSAILGIRLCSTFEGEASTTLEFFAEAYEETRTEEALRKEVEEILAQFHGIAESVRKKFGEGLPENEQEFFLPTERLVRLIIEKRLQGEGEGRLAWLFHVLLAEQITAGCKRAAVITGLNVCALSGGVFQNQLLLRLCEERLTEEGFRVLRHSLLPPNDGGIALGQAVAAMAYLKEKKREIKNQK